MSGARADALCPVLGPGHPGRCLEAVHFAGTCLAIGPGFVSGFRQTASRRLNEAGHHPLSILTLCRRGALR